MKEFDEFYNELVKSITEQVKEKILSETNVNQELDKPLTPEEVAKFLKVDKTTVYKLCKEGQIRSIKVGSIHSRKPHLRIMKKDLEEWINKSRK